MLFFKNVAGQGLYIFARNTANAAGETGDAANITLSLSLDGGSASGVANSLTEIGGGLYWLPLIQAETNANVILVYGSSSTANVVIDPRELRTTAGAIPMARYGGSGGVGTVDANNRIAGIQGAVNTLDDLATTTDMADELYSDARGVKAGAHVELDMHTSATIDKATVIFLESGERLLTGDITSPVLTIEHRETDNVLLDQEPLIAVGTNGFFKVDSSTKVPDGGTALCTASAIRAGSPIYGQRAIAKLT